MSPERASGAKADQRADIYSLGIVFYECLCGRRPFPENTLDALVAAKLVGVYASVERIVPGIPESVPLIVNKCLSLNPDKRYQTCEALQAALEKALAGLTLRSAADIITAFIKNPHAGLPINAEVKRKKPKKVSALFSGLIVLIAAAAVSFWLYTGTNPVTPGPLQPARHKPKDTTLSTQSAADTQTKKNQPKPLPKAPEYASTPQTLDALYKHNDFKGIIRQYGTVDFDTLSGSHRDSAVCILIESYYRTGNAMDALRVANRWTIRDGHYYLFLGLISLSFDKEKQAQDAFLEAVQYPSLFGPDITTNALYQTAVLLTRQFQNNPNDSLREAVLQSWYEFMDQGCESPSKECNEAQQNIQIFEP
jgi:serine/threonine protein kinase